MKMLAPSYVWWPGIDSDIQRKVQGCFTCQSNCPVPAKAPLHFWEFTQKPWCRLHIDHAGPFLGKYFFILIEAYSSSSSEVTIQKLQHFFHSWSPRTNSF